MPDAWQTAHGIFALLLAGLVALNIAVSSTTIDVSPLPTGQPTAPLAVAKDHAEALEDPQLDLSETLQRPIFSPNRRPFEAAPAPTDVPAPAEAESSPGPSEAPPSLIFQGTRVLKGRFSALVATGDNSAEWYEVGATVGGWRIKSIFADRLFVAYGDDTKMLSLYDREGMPADDQ